MKKFIALLCLTLTLVYACNTNKKSAKISDQIRINQLGFYPSSVKEFTAIDITASSFKIIDAYNNKVFSGELQNKGMWDGSGEHVMLGDFSSLTAPGAYYVIINDTIASYPFKIKKELYKPVLKSAIKSYYFQRASMAIDQKNGGKYHREAGHPDNKCIYHPSSGRSEGTLNSPAGNSFL